MLALQNNYDGKSEGERRKHVDKDELKRLFYRNETTFSFNKYVTNIKQTFNVIESIIFPYMRRKRSGNSWITSIVQTTI